MRREPELVADADVRALAPRARCAESRSRVLHELGLPHRIVNGQVLVSRHHLREWLAGRPVAPTRGPNLGGVR